MTDNQPNPKPNNEQGRKQANEQIAQMKKPPVVSAEAWHEAWQEMLVKEKELTRSRDALAAARRRMPWLAVEKEYVFEGPQGIRPRCSTSSRGEDSWCCIARSTTRTCTAGPITPASAARCARTRSHIFRTCTRRTPRWSMPLRIAGKSRASETADGLGEDPLVHDHG